MSVAEEAARARPLAQAREDSGPVPAAPAAKAEQQQSRRHSRRPALRVLPWLPKEVYCRRDGGGDNSFPGTAWGQRTGDGKEGAGGQAGLGSLRRTTRHPGPSLMAERTLRRDTATQGSQPKITALGVEDTDQSWGSKKQHKAINNRSKFRAMGDPYFLGLGGTQHRNRGQSVAPARARSRRAPQYHLITRTRGLWSHLRGWGVAMLVLRGQGWTLGVGGTVVLRGWAQGWPGLGVS